MDLILNQDECLTMFWSPTVVASGKNDQGKTIYQPVMIGRYGAGVGPKEVAEMKWKKPAVPDELEFTVSISKSFAEQNQSNELLPQWSSLVSFFESIDDDVEVSISNPSKKIEESVKKDCLIKEQDRKFDHEINKSKCDTLFKEMESLGACMNEDGYFFPEYQPLKEHLEVTKKYYDYTGASINICCHKDTKFYQQLSKAGILEKVYPEWYAKGAF